jgi:hypothetical protein
VLKNKALGLLIAGLATFGVAAIVLAILKFQSSLGLEPSITEYESYEIALLVLTLVIVSVCFCFASLVVFIHNKSGGFGQITIRLNDPDQD